jgi:predicted esterase YcpF (UPF0227 family)
LALPNANNPDFEESFNFLSTKVENLRKNDFVVGHSLGGYFTLKLLEKYDFNAILVAPVTNEENLYEEKIKTAREEGRNVDAMLKAIRENKVNFDNLKNRKISALLSDNDY